MKHSIRAADIRRFTEGDCHIFAYALNRITGWPVHTFVTECGTPDLHAFCVTPDGQAADIEGLHSISDFKAKWHCQTIADQGKFIEDEFWGRIVYLGAYSRVRARRLAPLVKAMYA